MVDQRLIKCGPCSTSPAILSKTELMLDFSMEVLKILICLQENFLETSFQ